LNFEKHFPIECLPVPQFTAHRKYRTYGIFETENNTIPVAHELATVIGIFKM